MAMTDKEARALVLALLGEADYDLAKSFDPKLSEDPEESERGMARMVKLVQRHVTKAAKKAT